MGIYRSPHEMDCNIFASSMAIGIAIYLYINIIDIYYNNNIFYLYKNLPHTDLKLTTKEETVYA